MAAPIAAAVVASAASLMDGLSPPLSSLVPGEMIWPPLAFAGGWFLHQFLRPPCVPLARGMFRRHAKLPGAPNRPCGKTVEALRKSEARFRDFAASSSDWYWEMGPDLRFSWFSSNDLEPRTGLKACDLLGRTRWDLAGADLEDPQWQQHVADLEAHRSFRNFIYPTRDRDGREVYLKVSGVPVFDRDGGFRGYRGTGSNITAEVAAERELREAQLRLADAIEGIADGFVLFDQQDRLVVCNQKYRNLYPELAELLNVGVPFEDIARAANERGLFAGWERRDEKYALMRLERHRAGGESFEQQLADGRWIEINDRITSNGQFVGLRRDITARKRAQEALRASEHRYRALVDSSVVGILIEQDGRAVFVNRTFATIFGFEEPEQVRALPSLENLFAPADIEVLRRHRGTLKDDATEDFEIQGVRRDGALIWLKTQLKLTLWNDRVAVQSTVVDVTLRRMYEERLTYQANFDSVTGLPNRSLAFDRLTHELFTAQQIGGRVGVMLIDIDHFKKINDTLGHTVGDAFLRQCGQRLSEAARVADTVARLGGDEFVVILPGIRQPEDIKSVADRILQVFGTPFALDDTEAFVTASIGIAVYPDDGDQREVLLRNADTAMYRAKEAGRNTVQCFTQELNRKAVERVQIETRLRWALDRGEFFLNYQPIVDLRAGRISGAEALIRWNNPDLGQVSPDRFIRLAEDTGLIVPIGSWVIGEVCRQASVWRDEGLRPLRLSLNVSSRQFKGHVLKETVACALDTFELPAECLLLEITEGLLLDEHADTKESLASLKSLGVCLAVDDFGTGYSSLSYLSRFPIDALKIDRSFIRGVPADAGHVTLVEAIVAMAHRLGLEVIAEGVEACEHFEFLRSLRCEKAQGFLFGRPVTAGEFAESVRTDWRTRPWARSLRPVRMVARAAANSANGAARLRG